MKAKKNIHAVKLGKKSVKVRLETIGQEGIEKQMNEVRAKRWPNKATELSTDN